MPLKRKPRRGEIWFAKLQVDPPGKGLRPVLIVSTDARNLHERANTIMVVPLTTTIHRNVATHLLMLAGETGLSADSAVRAEDLAVVRKEDLIEPRVGLRQVGNARICEIAGAVAIAMDCVF